jgi:uncharacterized protein (TIGR02996 family)
MNTGDALLQAIVEDPDDDALRLIYADWLQDHGAPSAAEFIRLELAMHPHLLPDGYPPDPWDDPEYHSLHARWEELVDQHSTTDWFSRLYPLVTEYYTERGFVFSIKVTAKQFVSRAAEIVAAAPLLDRVILERLGRHMPALARRPELAQIRNLVFFETTLGNAGLSELCYAPDLANLRNLDAMSNRIDTTGALTLAGSPVLTGLEKLDLSGNPIGDAGARALFAPGILPNLREIQLHGCGLGDGIAQALLERSDGAPLRFLNLALNQLTAAGLEALVRAPRLAALESLDLFGNPLEAGVRALVEAPFLDSLRKLGLGCVLEGTDEGALAALLRSPNLANVEELGLDGNDFGSDTLAALESTDVLTRVRKLGVTAGYSFDAEPLMQSLSRARLPHLRDLDLGYSVLSVPAITTLLASPVLAPVTRLDLRKCRLDTAAVEALAGADVLTNLRVLSLDENPIGNAGALALARSPHLGQLVELHLGEITLGKRARQALLDRFGESVCRF